MSTKYDPALKAFVTYDKKDSVRQILHFEEPFETNEVNPKAAIAYYLNRMAGTFKLNSSELKNLHKQVDYHDPRPMEMELRVVSEKRFFDSVTIGMEQTINNTPIWHKGVSVTLKQNPNRIIAASGNTVGAIKVRLAADKSINRFKSLFDLIKFRAPVRLLSEEGRKDDPDTGEIVRSFLKIKKGSTGENKILTAKKSPSRIIRGRFYYYQYNASMRQPFAKERNHSSKKNEVSEEHEHYEMPLPPVDSSIKNGQYYLVAEITFSWKQEDGEMITWLALVEVETDSILYIIPLAAGVNGLVFRQDPITSTGVLTNTANLSNASLNPFRNDVTLADLDAPDGSGVQHLVGANVEIVEVDGRVVAPPTQNGGDFDYDVRTNDFAAVSAYYHTNNFFKTIENLGFDLATYFSGTVFPVDIDHADMANVNAHCVGNGAGGIGHSGYGYGDDTNTTDPTIGRAVDNWVHWHELGGHGVLYGFVDFPNFGFAHSAGDGIAAIQNDPTSQLREIASVERFRYAPFRYHPLDRWFNRTVASGWGWGGVNDVGGYNSEQILATTHFRIYRAIGGDSANLGRRQFASRMMTYLILRAISTLTPATNPTDPEDFCDSLMAVDLLDWTSEGISGGAYNKVIRWAFEKQGSFQPAGAPATVTTPGAPPAVDVYINDGRNGEYDFQAVHWHNTSVWNRNAADGLVGHQDAVPGVTNYMYVKVKNRGTTTATNVNVKGYHCLPGAGLTWPVDFTQMGPAAGLHVASIASNNSAEVIVGPFEWIPNENIYGHDCALMIVNATGDPSNVANFTAGDTVAEWRLVPNDNNVGQRNVHILPGGGGERAFAAALDKRFFWAGNPFRKKAKMELKFSIPKFLKNAGWKLRFEGIDNNKFDLKSGEKRKVVIELIKGNDFTADMVKTSAENDITVELYADDQLLGGMTYRLDANKKDTGYTQGSATGVCIDKATDLLKCLKLGDNKIKNVCVKKVSIDIELDNDCKC
jgi:hypothetical protein